MQSVTSYSIGTCLAFVVLAAGCRKEQPAAPPTATEAPLPSATEPVRGIPAAAPAPTEPAPVAATGAEPVSATPGEAPSVAEAPPAAPPRDLGAELRAAVGSPRDCIRDYRPSSPTSIRIEVRAVVRPTGMIIEPEASGRGLSPNDTRCVEERVGAVVLRPLASASSETVSTFLEVAYTPPVVEEFDVAPPPPPAEGVVQALPKKEPIPPSGQPIEGPAPQPIEGPSGEPIEGPEAVPITGPKPVPIGSE